MGGNVKRDGWNGLEIPEAAIICNTCITPVDARAAFCDGCDRNEFDFFKSPIDDPFLFDRRIFVLLKES
jgi:hypothetical protein